MTPPTPETQRLQAIADGWWYTWWLSYDGAPALSEVALHQALVETVTLLQSSEQRLAEAEKRRLVVERRLVYLEWDGDWDELEGYVQAMLNQSASPAQPNDETCSCGHLWTSHNEHGCCWDDDCGCDKPRLAALAHDKEKP